MRSLLLVLSVAACGVPAGMTTIPRSPAGAGLGPAHDLHVAKRGAPTADPAGTRLVAKDPRVIDLDIIRIRAASRGIGSDPELTSIASADLFRGANEAAKAGNTADAIARYRQLIAEFPESQFAPVSLFNIAAIHDRQGDFTSTVATLRELALAYPNSRESIEGQLYTAAIQADHRLWGDTVATLEAALARANLTLADRIEAFARKGYALFEQRRYDAADAALSGAIAEWRKVSRLDDPYYIAMAHYYRGELMHRRFSELRVRPGDDEMVADLEAKRVLSAAAYDRWRDALGFKQAYWATASGYQMSQIFVELWEAHVSAPYPKRIAVETRPRYLAEVHDRVREHLGKALEGHRMNVELAKAFGVETSWSTGSEQQTMKIMELIAKEAARRAGTPTR